MNRLYELLAPSAANIAPLYARSDGLLVGFVNVAWDGASHAFILDTVVARSHRSRGIDTELVAVAVREAKAAGCEWLHVDFELHLRRFHFDSVFL